MKGKLIGFALAVLSVATVGLLQLTSEAKPGEVNNAPVCVAKAYGERSKAYKISGNTATVKFKVSGSKNCKVKLSSNSFYAPTMNGRPYNKQILFQRVTKIYTPGSYSMSVALPPTSNKAKGCYYQVDLTYGLRNVLPVLAYGHGKLNCNPPKPPTPAAACQSLAIAKIATDKYRFDANATVSGGARVSSYTFVVTRNGATVLNRTTASDKLDYATSTPGTYRVQVTVNTSVGKKTSANCVKSFTIPSKPTPAAFCKDLNVTKLERTKFRFDARSEVANGATVSSYDFVVSRGGAQVASQRVTTNALSASYTYDQTTAGDYQVRVTVNTSLGAKTSESCVKNFTVEQAPAAKCEDLTVTKIDRTNFRFDGEADVSDGATISGYEFAVYRGQTLIETKTVNTTATSASTNYAQATAGDYRVVLTVKTSLGDKTGPQCEAPFKVTPELKPGVKVTKHVENVKYKRVGVNIEYSYQIAVTNTGETDLKNVAVTDTPENGITLTSASAGSISGNSWTHTITELEQGATANFTLKAKVPVYLAGILTNTVCVDAPEVPGNPDDCDKADVEVPPKGKVYVCNPETGEIIRVDEDDADKYAPVDSPLCKEMVVCVIETKEVTTIKKSDFDKEIHTTDLSKCEETPEVPPTPEMPSELPQTGVADIAMSLLGATSLAGAGAYYLTSRRSRA